MGPQFLPFPTSTCANVTHARPNPAKDRHRQTDPKLEVLAALGPAKTVYFSATLGTGRGAVKTGPGPPLTTDFENRERPPTQTCRHTKEGAPNPARNSPTPSLDRSTRTRASQGNPRRAIPGASQHTPSCRSSCCRAPGSSPDRAGDAAPHSTSPPSAARRGRSAGAPLRRLRRRCHAQRATSRRATTPPHAASAKPSLGCVGAWPHSRRARPTHSRFRKPPRVSVEHRSDACEGSDPARSDTFQSIGPCRFTKIYRCTDIKQTCICSLRWHRGERFVLRPPFDQHRLQLDRFDQAWPDVCKGWPKLDHI